MAATLTTAILESTTAFYTSILVDQDDAPVASSQLTSLTLTYYDEETGEIINGRDFQNVLNVNDVTLDAEGLLTWTLQPEDTIFVDARRELEWHVALFTWLSLSGAIGRHEVRLKIENITKVS